MKISELWLREWSNPPVNREELCSQLTMSGLEIEECRPVSKQFSKIVIGKILSIEKHPEADRLKVCSVDVGESTPITIVCGANNVAIGMKVPCALLGAILPNNTVIKRSLLRGVESHGMLCSAVELEISEHGEGLFKLPDDAPIGENIWEYLKLDDYLFDIAITPNRGDCLSVLGIAKEVSAITGCQLNVPSIEPIDSTINDKLAINIQSLQDCPRYVGRIICDIQADVTTPITIQERLRRGGIRSINAVVDVMNYCMLELGQPMHAFDLHQLSGEIIVRKAKPQEELKLLDGQTLKLDAETLVISDQDKALAIAGIMGGLDSGVTLSTRDIFLESAFFNPSSIIRTSRYHHLNSESCYRFERGIDPAIQALAMERATELLLSIVGGKPGPIIDIKDPHYLPTSVQIILRKERINKILGFIISELEIEKIMHRLEFSFQKNPAGWQVTVPPRRSDITLEIDLIEEITRLYGYDQIPLRQPFANMQINQLPENKLRLSKLRQILCDLGFSEVVTYSFIDKQSQAMFDPERLPKELVNPISADMAVMRTNLWPGLVNTYLYNQNRQQSRVRIFEVGLCFLNNPEELQQLKVISGLISGDAFPVQWGLPKREVDFFDLKGNLECLFKSTLCANEFSFRPGLHPALHPGQTADIFRLDKKMGVMGALHPAIIQSLDIQNKIIVFELSLEALEQASIARLRDVSKFPKIHRDLAILVDRTVPSQLIQDTIKEAAGELLQDINIFDIYQGQGIAENRKSIALTLTIQHASRTLRDEEVVDLIERVVGELKRQFTAELRS